MDTSKTINCVEWFFGYGGNHLGLKRAIPNLRCVAACEIEAYAIANMVSKMEEGSMDPFPIWENCKTFPCEEFRGLVDIFVASYPCQGFSQAGERKGESDPRFLWPWVFRFCVIVRPRRVFFENVDGHVSLGLSTVISDLEAAGYRVETDIFSASEVGAPHQRKRVFILGELADAKGSRKRGLQLSEGRQSNGIANRTSKKLAISECLQCSSGPERTRWETGPDFERRSAGTELGHTSGDNERGASISGSDGQGVTIGKSGKQLANAIGSRHEGSKWIGTDEQGTPAHGPASECGYPRPEQLGNSRLRNTKSIAGLGCSPRQTESEGKTSELNRSNGSIWPAGLGQLQYDWEPPRITSFKRGLGRDAHGSSKNVERLRLLGNGVVPATAELAYRILNEKLELSGATR